VREALFARLDPLEGARVLDLFAGTGALGIEALSRGATSAVFVERSAGALAALRANLETLDLRAATRVVRGDATTVVRRLGRAGDRFDLVFLDPPYDSPDAGRALHALADSGILRDRARVVLETSSRSPSPEVPGLARLDERTYGDTRVVRFVRSGPASPQGGSVRQ
jgi:16S rRNA (guanine966-N2)-methyltransferase